MKTCGRCGVMKDLEAFAWRSQSKGTRQTYCRECHKGARRKHYEANRGKYIEKASQWRSDNRSNVYVELLAYFANHPCVDCGETDHEVLEFDHRDPAIKEFNLSKMWGVRTWESLLPEIQKCDVRCANCHRRRTNRQFGFWRAVVM